MRNKDLIKLLKKYDENTEIKIGGLMPGCDGLIGYCEEKLELTDIIESNYDGKTTIIITIPDLPEN